MFCIAVTTWQAWPSFYESEQINVMGEGDYLPYRLHEGDVLVQSFRPTRDGLTHMTLSFDLPADQSLPEDTQIRMTISSVGDKDPAEQLLLTEENLKLFARTEIPISIGRKTAGHSYLLTLKVEKLADNARLSIHSTHQRNDAMVVNGRSAGLATTMMLTFRTFNWLAFLAAVLLLGLIFVITFVPLPALDRLFGEVALLPLLIAPFLTLTTVELLNTLNTNILLSLPVFWLSLLTILIFELLLASLFGRYRLALIINHVIFVALGVANHMKLFFRGDPFVAGDLHSLTETAHTINQLRFLISSRFLLALLLTIIYLMLFWKTRSRGGTRRSRWIASAIMLSLLIAILNGLILNTNLIQKYLGITRYPWSQMVNYNQNGTIIPFVQSTRNLNAAIPARTINITPEMYQIPKAERRELASMDRPNIIAIMSESFCDFDNIQTIETSEPVTPFYDLLLNSPNTRHGNLLVSIFGGGTCNTEFEFLTGSSMLFMADGSLPYNSYFTAPSHGLPDLLGQQGYRTVAIHPYLRTFWDRNLVYPAIGFDKFISLEDFPEGGLVRDFVGDETDFRQITRTFDAKLPNERLFVFSVTMQNHFPYYSSEEVLSGLKYNIKLPKMTEVESVELYLSLLRQSDDALRDLIFYVSNLDEPTIVVLFGDHLPGNNNSFKNFYEMLYDKSLSDLNLSETEKLYETPWLIWANYELPWAEYDLPQGKSDVTSPNFLGTTVLDLAGAVKSPYFQQVSTLNQSIKAMSNKMVIMQNGRVYDRERIPSGVVKQLDRYWAAEYDNIVRDKSQ